MLPILLLTFAATIDIYPGDPIFDTLKALKPGDEAIIHAGTYDVPGYVNLQLAGTVDQPIVIRGADGEVAVIQGIPNQNAINIEGSHYTFKNLEIVGGSHGVRVGTSAHATFEDLLIRESGDVGLSCNRPMNTYEDITIRRVHIRDTGKSGGPGECMYLGCNNGDCKLWGSLVEFNLCHDTLSGSQGDGIELKTGSYDTIIRHNVVYNVNFPGITAYGTQGMPPNTIEGNVVWNVVDNGIQLVGDAIVRNNLVFDVGASGIAAKPSQGEIVKDLAVVHNTVIGAGDTCFRGNEFPAGGADIVVANNAFFCAATSAIKLPQGLGQAVFAANAVQGAVAGPVQGATIDGQSLAASFLDAAAMNVYPAGGAPLIDAGDPQHAVADDFNCLPRDGAPDIGAYGHSTPDNPGWLVQPDFKQCAQQGGTGTDTDTDTDGTGGGGGSTTDATTGEPGGTDSGAPTSGGPGGGTDEPPTTDGATGQVPGDSTAGTSDGPATGDAPGTGSAGDTDTAGMTEAAGCGCDADGGPAPGGLLALLAVLGLRRRRMA